MASEPPRQSKRKPGELVRWNVRLPVTATGILVVMVLGFSIAHYLYPAQRDAIVFFAVAVTAAATMGSTYYLGHSIRLQLAEKPQDEAFEYMARWNSPHLFHSRLAFYKVLQAHRAGGPSEVNTILADQETALGARAVLNLFEEISLAIETGHADEDLLARAFGGLVVRSHDALREWIAENRRISGRAKVWADFEALYSRWKDR